MLGVSGLRDRAEKGLSSVYRERAVVGREGVSERNCAAERCSGLLFGPSMTNIGRVLGDEGTESDSRSKDPVTVGWGPRGSMLAAMMARFCARTSKIAARRTAPLKLPLGPILETLYVRNMEKIPHLEQLVLAPGIVGVRGLQEHAAGENVERPPDAL